jgi:signal transduction histidine kinase
MRWPRSGISEEDRELLFKEFQTLSAKPAGGEKSTGLGLVITQKLIPLHGGKVGVESQLGEGPLFSLHFLSAKDLIKDRNSTFKYPARGLIWHI